MGETQVNKKHKNSTGQYCCMYIGMEDIYNERDKLQQQQQQWLVIHFLDHNVPSATQGHCLTEDEL